MCGYICSLVNGVGLIVFTLLTSLISCYGRLITVLVYVYSLCVFKRSRAITNLERVSETFRVSSNLLVPAKVIPTKNRFQYSLHLSFLSNKNRSIDLRLLLVSEDRQASAASRTFDSIQILMVLLRLENLGSCNAH